MKNTYYILILSVSLLFSCKRDAEKLAQIGPAYVTTEEPFAISSNPADFTVSGSVVNFKAKLTTTAAWQIEIIGMNSGARKIFTDTSQYIDITNTSWDGSSDTTWKFRSEPCTATLYLPASNVTKNINFNSYIGPFSITQPLAISADPANFGVPVSFSGELNRVRSWVITINGTSSGAKKQIMGYSKSISNALWDGSSDTALFFRAEDCEATLSFPDTNLTQTVNFTIASPKTHPGYLISDYETTVLGTYMGSYIGNYFDAPDKATSTIDILAFTPAPQGNKVLRFDCNDVNSSYYTGGAYHNSAAANYGIPVVNNDSLYLNMFVYGYAGGNAALSIEVRESDGDGWSPAQLNITWIGWKLVSFKYANMPDKSSTGNKTRESNKINAININMNSIPQGQHCKTLVDYLIFTKGEPLKP